MGCAGGVAFPDVCGVLEGALRDRAGALRVADAGTEAERIEQFGRYE